MKMITSAEWQTLPETAQKEVYDFFLFLKQRYAANEQSETVAFSNHTANIIEDWANDKEDDIWK